MAEDLLNRLRNKICRRRTQTSTAKIGRQSGVEHRKCCQIQAALKPALCGDRTRETDSDAPVFPPNKHSHRTHAHVHTCTRYLMRAHSHVRAFCHACKYSRVRAPQLEPVRITTRSFFHDAKFVTFPISAFCVVTIYFVVFSLVA